MTEEISNAKKWYVLRAVSGKEKKVKDYIDSEIVHHGFSDYISQVLIPTEKVYQIRNGKKISKERSYFPGYIMIEAFMIGEIPHILKNIPGVIGFLGDKGQPIPLRLAEVNRILGKVDELFMNKVFIDNGLLIRIDKAFTVVSTEPIFAVIGAFLIEHHVNSVVTLLARVFEPN